ncbi:MAG: DUF433 domain-containing protein [Burkholderiales bacterium]
MKKFDRIASDVAVMNGQPVIKGTRITVKRVVEAVALYLDRDELFREYPELQSQDVRQALEYAASSVGEEIPIMEAA